MKILKAKNGRIRVFKVPIWIGEKTRIHPDPNPKHCFLALFLLLRFWLWCRSLVRAWSSIASSRHSSWTKQGSHKIPFRLLDKALSTSSHPIQFYSLPKQGLDCCRREPMLSAGKYTTFCCMKPSLATCAAYQSTTNYKQVFPVLKYKYFVIV